MSSNQARSAPIGMVTIVMALAALTMALAAYLLG